MTVTVSSWVGRGGPTASSGEGARHLGGSLCVPGLPAARPPPALRLCPVRAPSPEAAACLGVSPHFSSHQGPGGCEAWAEVDLWGGGQVWGPQLWFPPPCTPHVLCPPRCWPVPAGGTEPSSDPTPGGLTVIHRQRGERVSGRRRLGGSLGRPRCLD